MIPDVPDDRYEQEEDCAFWRIQNERGAIERQPIDDHAIYGRLRGGGRADEDHDVPHRNALRDLTTAIRVLGARHDLKHHPDDRMRVNDGGWMEVVQPQRDGPGFVDEGFLARYEDGSVLYAIRANDHGANLAPPENRMRRWDDHSSAGVVHCLEVDWGER